MYAPQSGGGQVGVGPNSPLGNRYGAYAELMRQRIAQNWQTNGLDSRSQSTPAIVSFTIMRDGTVRNPQVTQSSGNPNIDNTALRAVYDSNPMPALPAQISENVISPPNLLSTYADANTNCFLPLDCRNRLAVRSPAGDRHD